MITEKEINPKGYPLTHEQWQNFFKLYYAVNEVRHAWGKEMTVTSGFRTIQEHARIYNAINEQRKSLGLNYCPIPLKSPHLMAAACDFLDLGHELYHFCEKNEDLLVHLGLYVEDLEFTPTWCHFQTTPTSKRFFKAY